MIRNAATKAETSTVSVGPSSLGSVAGVVENSSSSSSNISPAAPTVTLTTRDLQEFTVDAEIVRLFGIKAPEPKSTLISHYHHHHHHHPFYRKRLFNDFLMDDASDGFPGVSLVSEEEEEEEEEELNRPQPSLPNLSGPAFAVALSWAKHHLSRPKQLQASTMAYRLVEHRDAGPRVATSGPGGGSLHYLANRLFPVDLWDVQFVSGLSGEQLQMLLEAANYLNMGWLLDRQCQVAVRKMTEGGRDFVRDTAEEEANLLKVARECSFDTSAAAAAAAAARRVNSNSNSTGNGNGNANSGNANKCQKVAAGVDVKGKNTSTSTASTSIASTGNLAASFSKRLQMMSKGRVAGGKGKSAVISKSSATSSSSNTIVDVPAAATGVAAAAAAPVQRATRIAAKSG
ncbi:hypothetical protein TYRP_022474 [Tyrophagus putrescentiae]|nr:hypothetical protein TYRP_022474 [Tyrophagus putrescentiae]